MIRIFSFALLTLIIMLEMGCINPSIPVDISIVQDQIRDVSSGETQGILLCDTRGTDQMLIMIAQDAPSVKSLALSSTDVTKDGFAIIGRLPQLNVLEIDTQPNFSREIVDIVVLAPQLKRIVYRGSDDAVLQRLRELKLAE